MAKRKFVSRLKYGKDKPIHPSKKSLKRTMPNRGQDITRGF